MCCCILFYIHDINLSPSLKFQKPQVWETNEVVVCQCVGHKEFDSQTQVRDL